MREDTGAEYCSEDLISEIFVISKVSLTSTREEKREAWRGSMLTCSTWLVAVSLGPETAWGQVGSSADVEVVSTISPGWKTPPQYNGAGSAGSLLIF